jgi:zinc/manganese transport system permease protein
VSDALILLPGFAFALLLVASHTYFGLHVLARGIIFVDLALAQIAVLGASVAFLLGEDAHGSTALAAAFVATLIAAMAFALLRRVPDKTTREVLIGSAYVVATALSILVLSRSIQGMEELRNLFNGSVLWVRWDEVLVTGGVYAAVAAVHVLFRDRLLALSFAGEGSARPPLAWELLFFVSFAIVITLAVGVAGILMVFAFLIVPAFSASLVAATLRGRLIAGWGLGAAGALAGLAVAYAADLPVGATIVSVVGILPVVAGFVRLRASGGRAPR